MTTAVSAVNHPLPCMALPLRPLPQPPNIAPAPAPAPVPVPVPENPENMYKNKLQEYTQKSGLPFPVYQTVKEGPAHAPRFRCTVCVNGEHYTTPTTFCNRKAAEQGAARAVLTCIPQPQNANEDTCPDVSLLVHEDTTFCKSILNEYAAKKHMEKPAYDTIQSGGLLPAFTSSVVLNGINYKGATGRNKKEAEQLAARAAILSILESVSGKDIYEVVKSKLKLYAAISGLKENSTGSYGVPVVNAENPLDLNMNKRKQDGEADGSINLPSSGISVSNLNTPSIQAAPGLIHEFKKQKADAILSTASPLITFVPASSERMQLPPVAGVKQGHQGRRRKKSRKGPRVNNQVTAAVVTNPVSQ